MHFTAQYDVRLLTDVVNRPTYRSKAFRAGTAKSGPLVQIVALCLTNQRRACYRRAVVEGGVSVVVFQYTDTAYVLYGVGGEQFPCIAVSKLADDYYYYS